MDCSRARCGPGGQPSGDRDDAGNCICDCIPGWTGLTCSESTEFCAAPLKVENAPDPPCIEGRDIKDGVCTTKCKGGYVPTSKSLQCFRKTLTPATFECVKITGMSDTICFGMQVTAITVMVASGLFLVWRLAQSVEWTSGRPVNAFVLKEHKVGTLNDDFGAMHVLKPNEGHLRKIRYPPPKGARRAAQWMHYGYKPETPSELTPKPPDVEPPRLPGQHPHLSTVPVEDDWDSSDEDADTDDIESARFNAADPPENGSVSGSSSRTPAEVDVRRLAIDSSSPQRTLEIALANSIPNKTSPETQGSRMIRNSIESSGISYETSPESRPRDLRRTKSKE